MVCDYCGKPATFHQKVTINGVSSEQHLCSDCANDGDYQQSMFHIGSFFDEFTNHEIIEKNTCDACGSTFEDFKKSALVGCSRCYDIFHDQLYPIIEKMQGASIYVGKKLNIEESLKEHKINQLKDQIRELVEHEDYEQAARLKKQLDELKGEK